MLLMNPTTGTIQSSEDWESDMVEWSTNKDGLSPKQQFETLIEVNKDGEEINMTTLRDENLKVTEDDINRCNTVDELIPLINRLEEYFSISMIIDDERTIKESLNQCLTYFLDESNVESELIEVLGMMHKKSCEMIIDNLSKSKIEALEGHISDVCDEGGLGYSDNAYSELLTFFGDLSEQQREQAQKIVNKFLPGFNY